MSAGGIEAVYRPDGDHFVPTELARGPWDPGAQHGGPVAALIGRAVERFDRDPGLFVTRVSLELLRPVPLAPLAIELSMARPGKRVQLVSAAVRAGDTEVVRATALRVRAVPEPIEDVVEADDKRLPGPEEAEPVTRVTGEEGPPNFGDAMDFRVLGGQGGIRTVGPGKAWFRLRVPLVAGEEPSPLARVLTVADFGNGVGSAVDFERYMFINPDLTVHLRRLPVGEWVGLDAATWLEPGAGGFAEGALHDTEGRVGRSVQALYVAERQGWP